MSRQIQIRRGSAAENDAFTGAIGEVTMDTTNNTLRVHDGTTAGGTTLAKQSALTDKLNTSLDNISDSAKATSVSWGRQFTVVNSTIANGNASIAREYSLGFTDNKVKIGIFQCDVRNASSNGSASIAIKTDVMTSATQVAATNAYISVGTATVPFINKITISFPIATGGIAGDTSVKFIGWM